MSLFAAFTVISGLVAFSMVLIACLFRMIRTNLYLKATLKESGEAYRLLQRATQQRAAQPARAPAPAPAKKAPKKKRAPAKPRQKKVKLSVWDRLKKPEV